MFQFMVTGRQHEVGGSTLHVDMKHNVHSGLTLDGDALTDLGNLGKSVLRKEVVRIAAHMMPLAEIATLTSLRVCRLYDTDAAHLRIGCLGFLGKLLIPLMELLCATFSRYPTKEQPSLPGSI
jgi:hypothetical protein